MDDVEKEELQELKGSKIDIIMGNGFHQKGILIDFDRETLLIDASEITNKRALVYRSNISMIKEE